MELELRELTETERALQVYDIYKHCMYMPTEERFIRKMTGYIDDCGVRIFECLCHGQTKGVIVISLSNTAKAEILGIATDENVRGMGIGSYMIKRVSQIHPLSQVYAETDSDAVGFYQKNGFEIVEEKQVFGDEKVSRYKCTLEI